MAAEHGLVRVVVADLRRHRGALRHVRRVAEDQVDQALQLHEQRRIGDVPRVKPDRGVTGLRLPVGVPAGPGERGRILLDRMHIGVRAGVSHRQGKRPGPCAEVHHGRPVHAFQRRQAPREQQLCLRARHEHSRPDTQRDVS